jgi:hypothetical protein
MMATNVITGSNGAHSITANDDLTSLSSKSSSTSSSSSSCDDAGIDEHSIMLAPSGDCETVPPSRASYSAASASTLQVSDSLVDAINYRHSFKTSTNMAIKFPFTQQSVNLFWFKRLLGFYRFAKPGSPRLTSDFSLFCQTC